MENHHTKRLFESTPIMILNFPILRRSIFQVSITLQYPCKYPFNRKPINNTVNIMSENKSIFSIKFEKYTAELEISELSLQCITGDVIHFDIPLNELRTYVQISHNTILFSFYQSKLKQITISSKYCISIIKYLDSLVKSA